MPPLFERRDDMTAQEIYKAALSKIFEREGDDEDFQYFFLEFLNACLAEALPCENSIRAAAGREELDVPQVVTSMSETVDVDARIARIALPYGVAAYYFQDDDDDYKSQDYRGRFIGALNDLSVCVPGMVEDCYAN